MSIIIFCFAFLNALFSLDLDLGRLSINLFNTVSKLVIYLDRVRIIL